VAVAHDIDDGDTVALEEAPSSTTVDLDGSWVKAALPFIAERRAEPPAAIPRIEPASWIPPAASFTPPSPPLQPSSLPPPPALVTRPSAAPPSSSPPVPSSTPPAPPARLGPITPSTPPREELIEGMTLAAYAEVRLLLEEAPDPPGVLRARGIDAPTWRRVHRTATRRAMSDVAFADRLKQALRAARSAAP
jgi:hypothetical protein